MCIVQYHIFTFFWPNDIWSGEGVQENAASLDSLFISDSFVLLSICLGLNKRESVFESEILIVLWPRVRWEKCKSFLWNKTFKVASTQTRWISIKSKCYAFFCTNTLCGSKNMNEKCIKWVWEWPPENLLKKYENPPLYSFRAHYIFYLNPPMHTNWKDGLSFLWFPLGEFSKLAYLVPCGFGGTAGRESDIEFGRELRWLESPLLVLACDRHFEYIWWQLPIVKSEKERGHSHLCTAIHRHILLPVHIFTPFLQRLLSHCLALLFLFDHLFIADLRNDGGDTLLVDALTHSLVLQMMRGVPSAD